MKDLNELLDEIESVCVIKPSYDKIYDGSDVCSIDITFHENINQDEINDIINNEENDELIDYSDWLDEDVLALSLLY